MKSFYKFLNNIRENNFEKWPPLLESLKSFLYILPNPTKKGCHVRDAMDLRRTMAFVIVALLPCLLFGMWNIGHFHFLSIGKQVAFWDKFLFGLFKILPVIFVTYLVGFGIEFVFVFLRKHEIYEGFLVTGLLIPLILPADVSLWMVALATAFAVIIGKEVFGGTGKNILNPALLAKAFLFFAMQPQMSGSIPLAEFAAAKGNLSMFYQKYAVSDMFWGLVPGPAGDTSVFAVLLGVVILLFTGIASWRIMLSVFAGGYVTGFIFNAVASNPYMDFPAYQHLMLGGFAFGAVFMATDPVTSAQTNTGKYIYGLLTGIIAVLIRVFNPSFSESVMIAILLMNIAAPLIDQYVIYVNIKRRLNRSKIKV